jgi:hypothetical protein
MCHWIRLLDRSYRFGQVVPKEDEEAVKKNKDPNADRHVHLVAIELLPAGGQKQFWLNETSYEAKNLV